jgi:hypothetical protein
MSLGRTEESASRPGATRKPARGGIARRARVLRTMLIAAAIGAIAVARAHAGGADEDASGSELDRLIEQFDAGAPEAEGSVRLDAWIETGAEPDEVVVVLEPQGAFKLVADPGITITPTAQPGVEWLVPLPYRHVDSESQYFTPPASLRLPFRADAEQPLEILVEYAYCVVDYQCFFGEELLTVAARYD